MGCDIHASIEYKEHEWYRQWAADVELDRNYDLFAYMADVRNYGEPPFNPVSHPRGLPDDVSWEIKRASADYGRDGHSHSWLNVADLDEVQRRMTQRSYGNAPEESLAVVLAAMRLLPNARLVFWFDN